VFGLRKRAATGEHEFGTPCTALEIDRRLTPPKSPQTNGISEAFVKTLKRDYVRVNPLPDAETFPRLIGDWIEDDNDNHPHSGLKWRSPREFTKAKTETA